MLDLSRHKTRNVKACEMTVWKYLRNVLIYNKVSYHKQHSCQKNGRGQGHGRSCKKFAVIDFQHHAKFGYCVSSDVKVKVKVKMHTLDIAPLRSESPPQKRSGMARVLRGFHSFTCTPTCSSAIGMSHTCLCLPSRSWYSFTDPGGMEG